MLLLLPLLSGGCLTHALWTRAALDDYKEPYALTDLQLFDAKKDFLVVYQEYSERNDKIRTRGYLLHQNEIRLAANKRPKFINAGQSKGLEPVAVFSQPFDRGTNALPAVYAVAQTNHQSFTIYSNQLPAGAYDLPTYNDGKGKYERIALTPFSVIADLTIVGGFIGLEVWAARAGGTIYIP